MHLGLGVAGPVTGYSNNVLIIAGGANFPDSLPLEKGGKKKYYNKVYVFKKMSAQLQNFNTSIQLPFNIAYLQITLLRKALFMQEEKMNQIKQEGVFIELE